MAAVIAQTGTIYPCIAIVFTVAVIALTGVVIVISHTTSVGRVVIPMGGASIVRHAAAIVKTLVVVVMVIDHHNTALIPVAAAEIKLRAYINTRAPIKAGHKYIAARVMPVDGGIIRPPPIAVDHTGVIGRHIHHALNRGFDHNGFLFADHTHMLDL